MAADESKESSSTENPPSTSLLAILSLYISLRRSGSSEREAQGKLRGLVGQLSSADRRELVRSANDWESKHGEKLQPVDPTKAEYRATMVITPDAAQMYGESRYDQISSTSMETVLKPLHHIISCPKCGKKNDSTKTTCAYCGALLHAAPVPQVSQDVPPTWFGPASQLVLTISGASRPLELPVHSVLTLGRHTPENTLADVDLSKYQGDVYGVSRMHASIKRQDNSLNLSDMNSKNHTFLNGRQLQESEVCPLKNGDRISLGNLLITVSFKHPNR